MILAKPWNGKDLKGDWEVTYKIDGVRALWTSEGWMSRANKKLFNIPMPRDGRRDCEVYLGDFKKTIRAVRTKTLKADTPKVFPCDLYSLDPLDFRLKATVLKESLGGVRAGLIRNWLLKALAKGYEGLVLRQGDKWLKVKPVETHDVLITGAIEGEGKHKRRLGALMTSKGKVGTGFSDSEREELWKLCRPPLSGLIGETIEVSCMHFTPDGKFRHPRFIRMRPDKVADA